jgi:hypothetical protein
MGPIHVFCVVHVLYNLIVQKSFPIHIYIVSTIKMGLSTATRLHIGRNEILTTKDEKQTTKRSTCFPKENQRKREKNPPQYEKKHNCFLDFWS